ncbi:MULTISPECIES: hypothetical protein [Streptomyces]|uniref:DUF2690 domain-containing protein n=1 Tax=Streptomyces olivaceiscleroticus TaxID=68245 RepID=A0ABN0ZY05_9ACTN|nr:hypothetical protein [Streptomyces niger]
MRYAKRALVGLTCAFALVPAGAAMAGTGPAPAPSERSLAKSTAPSATGNPLSAKAQAAGVCSDAYAIGNTGYITRQGVKIASVKQFYSPKCQQNYGYLWVWDSFRAKAGDYDVSTSIYSYSKDEILGTRTWTNSTAQEFWSNGTATVKACTAGIGSLRQAGDPVAAQGASSKRC